MDDKRKNLQTETIEPSTKPTWLWRIIGLVCGVLLISSCSFASGMLFQANVYPMLVAASSLGNNSLAAQRFDVERNTANNQADFGVFWEAWTFLNQEFYGDIPADEARLHGAIRGMVATFGDQHTAFIEPVRSAINRENMGGSFEGIGASIRVDETGRLLIADPFPGRPAFNAGLRPNDVILAIDGASTEGLGLYDAVQQIRGPANSIVTLTIFREGESSPRDFDIVRARIEIEVVQTERIGSEIAHIRLTQFSEGASDKILQALNELQGEGVRKLILDLRSNPGGLLTEAINVSSLFVDGTIVVEKLKGGQEKLFTSADSHQTALDLPVVILVNGGSASASEIVAGAVQDTGRGLIVGEQTFGKGSVQIPHRLKDGSELRVTIAEWLTPLRRQIHETGITPDLPVEMTADDFERGLDPQLDRAIEYLLIQ